jgi:biotin synthase
MIPRSEPWTFERVWNIFQVPFTELLYAAQTVHRMQFNPSAIQVSTLLSVKTGGCSENCGYCSQSAHHTPSLPREPLMDRAKILQAAKNAKDLGSTRFCVGTSGRGPHPKELLEICEIVREVKKLGLEVCATLGLLEKNQATQLKEAGLDFYNHNIDTSPDYYGKIVTTRTFEDRLQTLEYVRSAGIQVCCGGILGMGETHEDWVKMLVTLANFSPPPESVPINWFVPVSGTPLSDSKPIDSFDFVRMIALTRIVMPKSFVRLSAGRDRMSDELQTLCFLAGANSIFQGDKLLTVPNANPQNDDQLFQRLNLFKLERETSITSGEGAWQECPSSIRS